MQQPEHARTQQPQPPLTITLATPGFEATTSNGTRLTSITDTLNGSSASPLFDRTYQGAALHHNRGQIDPQAKQLLRNTQAIPLATIRAAPPTTCAPG